MINRVDHTSATTTLDGSSNQCNRQRNYTQGKQHKNKINGSLIDHFELFICFVDYKYTQKTFKPPSFIRILQKKMRNKFKGLLL